MLGSQLSACPNEKIEGTLLNLKYFLTHISRYLEFTPAWNYDSYLIRQGYKSALSSPDSILTLLPTRPVLKTYGRLFNQQNKSEFRLPSNTWQMLS